MFRHGYVNIGFELSSWKTLESDSRFKEVRRLRSCRLEEMLQYEAAALNKETILLPMPLDLVCGT